MEKHEFKELTQKLFAYFNKEPNTTQIAIWHEYFGNLPHVVYSDTIETIIAQGWRLPTIEDVKPLVKEAKRKHTPAVEQKKKQAQGPHIPQCEWEVDSQRCLMPGTLSSSTHGSGSWLCVWHYDNSGGDRDRFFKLNVFDAPTTKLPLFWSRINGRNHL